MCEWPAVWRQRWVIAAQKSAAPGGLALHLCGQTSGSRHSLRVVAHRFDVVAFRVDDEGTVVILMAVRAQAGDPLSLTPAPTAAR